jgi:hypothetical protein
MKTTSQKNTKGNPEPKTGARLPIDQQEFSKTEACLPIDPETRKTNRGLPTDQVIALLQQTAPELLYLAEVVGKWIWIQFRSEPAPEVRQKLSQLGFHWNNSRQTWQHPCGQFRQSSGSDPREKYPNYYPADQKTA